MIDTLAAFGCSHTQGDESISDNNIGVNKEENIYHAYPYFLSKLLQCKTYLNFARVGSSNHEIARSVIKQVETLSPQHCFLVIGWTDNNRSPVVTYTPKSYKILRKLYETLSPLKRLQYYKRYKQQICPVDTKEVTISKGVIRIIHAKLFGIANLKKHEKYTYEKNIQPYFNDDFITGFEKHIFNTAINSDANNMYILAVEHILQSKGFNYLMFKTMGEYEHQYNNYFSKRYYHWEKTENYLSIIHEYGSKYGIADSGVHMKALAHKKLADFLYTEIYRRELL